MISVYESNETNFSHNGIVVLNECKSAFIQEELNGVYELELEHTLDKRGKWQNLVEQNIVKAGGQLFRIYRKEKTLQGIKINARHIFYDLANNFLEDVSPSGMTGAGALNYILTNTQYAHPFSSMGDVGGNYTSAFVRKNPVEAILGDEGIVSVWGGELVRDNFNIKLLQARGLDRGVLVSYGKNIVGIDETLIMDSVCTRVFPVGKDNLTLTEKYLDSSLINNYPYPLIKTVDFSEVETEAELRQLAQAYLDANDKPVLNYRVDFIELTKTSEYKNYSVLESVYMGDIVTIRHSKLNVDLKAKVIRIKRNELTNRIEEVELGSFRPSLNDGITSPINEVKRQQAQDKTALQKAIDDATLQINSALGGYVVKRNGELLIMDTEDIMTATKVWRWNQGGLGYSSTGYNGPYATAITADGSIVADFITTGKLNAAVVQVGSRTTFEEGYDPNAVLSNFVTNTYNKDKDAIQAQIDGSITTWFYNYEPSLDNEPVILWLTDDDKNRHLGDLFYNTATGYAYRFAKDISNVYSWIRLTDTDITKALSDAATAQDTADGKRTIFVAQPIPPYQVGDLWNDVTTSSLRICRAEKLSGLSFDELDWIPTTVSQQISDMASDNKITPVEKKSLNTVYNGIKAEKISFTESASKYTLPIMSIPERVYAVDADMSYDLVVSGTLNLNDSTKAIQLWPNGNATVFDVYVVQYDNITGYLSTLLSSMDTISDINPDLYKAYFNAYYTAKANLQTELENQRKNTMDSKVNQTDMANGNLDFLISQTNRISVSSAFYWDSSGFYAISGEGDTAKVVKITAGGIGISVTGINGAFKTAITGEGINGETMMANTLIVGENVSMGKGAVITWDGTGVNGVIPPSASDVGALPYNTTIPTQYTDTKALQAWISSGYATYIDSNGVYSKTMVAQAIETSTLSTVKISGAMDAQDIIKIGTANANGTCQIDSRGDNTTGGLRLQSHAAGNYMAVFDDGSIGFFVNDIQVASVSNTGQFNGTVTNVSVTAKFA